MSIFDGVPLALIYAGPPQDYPAAAAASSAAQSLVTGASGGFSQPYIPQGFIPLSGSGRLVMGSALGKVTGQASATTMAVSMGLATASNSIVTGAVTLVTSPVITMTSFASAGWEFDFKCVIRGAGYGTTTVATSVLTSATMTVSNLTTAGITTQAAPNLVTTVDASVTQWLWWSVTFSTSSTTNSCTLQEILVMGGS
jgi:hypothetical protein